MEAIFVVVMLLCTGFILGVIGIIAFVANKVIKGEISEDFITSEPWYYEKESKEEKEYHND